jgi:[acyl-carrier-protein] S-malonyltransferase
MRTAAERNPGAMVAVLGRPYSAVAELVAGCSGVMISNINAPEQIVVGGAVPAVQEFMRVCEGAKVKMIPLKVSGAFHTPLMEPARELLREELQRVAFAAPAFPVYANSTGESLREPARIRETLGAQLVSPVQWVRTVEGFPGKEGLVLVELGPKKVLSGLVAKISPSRVVLNVEDERSLGEALKYFICLRRQSMR